MSLIKLYGYATSPFVRKTGCFLYYKGIEFVHVPVDPTNPGATLGHTNGTQVPVLEIDGTYRRESSEHALWLDELFPERPLCPPQHRAKILEIDAWISDVFLTSIFRGALDSELTLQFRYRGWRLAALVSAHTPLPEHVRHYWPEALKNAPFILEMAKHMDLMEPVQNMQMRIFGELVSHLGNGPYFGEMKQPTMLDLAVFPQLVFGYMFGLEENLVAAAHPAVNNWMRRMTNVLPANPTLVADMMQIHSIESGLE